MRRPVTGCVHTSGCTAPGEARGSSVGVKHARLRRHVEIRHIGVPDGLTVTQAADLLPVYLDVGDNVDFRQALDKAAAVLLDRRPIEIAQAAAERDQILVAERLAAE